MALRHLARLLPRVRAWAHLPSTELERAHERAALQQSERQRDGLEVGSRGVDLKLEPGCTSYIHLFLKETT